MKRFAAILLALVLLASSVPALAAGSGGGDKLVAITFDDGPGPYTEALLDALKTRGVQATFFVLGSRVERYGRLVERMYGEGHQIANHTYSHKALKGLSDAAVTEQITSTAQIISAAAGKELRCVVRPPYGSYNARVLELLGAPGIFWSIDPEDWKYRNADTVFDHIVSKVRDGDIILLHDIHPTSVDAAVKVVDKLLADGYTFVTVNELFRRKGVPMEDGVMYFSCRNATVRGALTAPAMTYEIGGDGCFITLASADDAPIYYTTDGSDPLYKGKLYSSPVKTYGDCTVRAVAAFELNGSRSPVMTQELAVSPAAPAITAVGTRVTITGEGRLFYTLDGKRPTINSNRYTGAFTAAPGTLIRAVAIGEGNMISAETRETLLGAGALVRDAEAGDWYYGAVEKTVTGKLMFLTDKQYFKPDVAMTRASVLETLYRMAGSPPVSGAAASALFADVSDNASYAGAVRWAYQNGICTGEGGRFHPSGYVTREELAAFLYRLARVGGQDVSAAADLRAFADADTVDAYAAAPLAFAVAKGLMNGEEGSELRPHAYATRAQVAVIVTRYMALYNK